MREALGEIDEGETIFGIIPADAGSTLVYLGK